MRRGSTSLRSLRARNAAADRRHAEPPPDCSNCAHSARPFEAMPQLLFCKNRHVVAALAGKPGQIGIAENQARIFPPCGWRGELFSKRT